MPVGYDICLDFVYSVYKSKLMFIILDIGQYYCFDNQSGNQKWQPNLHDERRCIPNNIRNRQQGTSLGYNRIII